MTTIRDVAHEADVSTATVSAVLNESSYVSPKLKARVVAAVDKLDYMPSGVARNLKRGRSQLIALIVADLSNPFFSQVVCAAEEMVAKHDFSLVVFNSDEKPETEKRIFSRMRALGCDGAIMSPVAEPSEYARREFQSSRLPIVLIDRYVDGLNCDSVTLDNVAAGRQATEHLLDLGHERIGSITGPLHVSTAKGRHDGFVEAMEKRGLTPLEAHVHSGEFREDAAYLAATEILGTPNRPTALYVANGPMLLGVMHAIHDLGLACPEDISIAVTDKLPGSGEYRPRITRTEQPARDMATEAIRLLMDRINSGIDIKARNVVFQPTFVTRESTIPLQQSGPTK